jgi:hypothetical protein
MVIMIEAVNVGMADVVVNGEEEAEAMNEAVIDPVKEVDVIAAVNVEDGIVVANMDADIINLLLYT